MLVKRLKDVIGSNGDMLLIRNVVIVVIEVIKVVLVVL